MPFIKVNRLSQLAKKAYANGHLVVGQMETDALLVVKTPASIVAIREPYATNKYKAMITELIGSVPHDYDDHTFTRHSKKEEPMQMGIDDAVVLNRTILDDRAGEAYDTTAFTVTVNGAEYRLLQSKLTGEIKAVNEEFLALITLDELNPEIESLPVGPEFLDGVFRFENHTTTLIVSPRTLGEYFTEAISALSQLTLKTKQ
jgi:hypothetical protein